VTAEQNPSEDVISNVDPSLDLSLLANYCRLPDY
jgi:hypothetical protein